jgi:small subunit ribosomal protein S4e
MSKDLKRITAPRSWPVPKKTNYWIQSPAPGPHAVENCMPASVVLRDILKVCDTAKEARAILDERQMLVDGKVITSVKHGIGLMDIVSLPKANLHYRMMINRRGKLTLVRVPEGKETWKLCRIENKTTVPGGRTQLNLHDGRNIIVAKDSYKTGDVLKIEVPSQKILDSYKMTKGSTAMIIGGSNVGALEVIEESTLKRMTAPNLIIFKDGTSTIIDNVFVVGAKGPEVELPEASAL